MKEKKIESMYKILWDFAKAYKLTFFALYLCLVFETILQAITPLLIATIIDEVIYYKNIKFFWIIAACYGVCLVGLSSLYFLHPNIWQYLMTKYLFDIRQKVYNNILYAKSEYLSNMKTGDLVAIIDKDVSECMHVIQRNIFHYVNNVIALIIVMSIIMVFNWKIGLVVIVFVPIYVFATKKFGEKAKDQSKQERKVYGSYVSWVYEMLKGLREIKLMSAENNVVSTFKAKYKDIISVNIKTAVLSFKVEQLLKGIAVIVNAILYIILAFTVYNGELTIGAVVAILAYYGQAEDLITQISNRSIQKKLRSASVERVYRIITMDIENDKQYKKSLNITAGNIVFENVDFAYEGREKIFDNFNFEISRGDNVCLVGESGVGKSTLSSLITKFLSPQKGKICIDGQDISECTYLSIRKNIGIVLQEVLIFKGTIRYNLQLAKKDATDEEMMDALDNAVLGVFVRNLPNGLGTELSYGGTELSGGQRQRLSITRIYLKDPEIIILDEATSALDNESEKAINEALSRLRNNRTTLTISHRISTVIASDKVAVLEKGKIVGFAYHKELIENNDVYQRLFEKQYLAEEGGIA